MTLDNPLLKVVLPFLAILAIWFSVRRRNLSWRDDMGVVRPSIVQAILWIGGFVAYMLLSDHVLGWRGPWDFSVWARLPLVVAVLRVLAVCFFGPIAEELIFRGLGYHRLSQTRLGAAGAIVLTAAVWAVIHTAYSGEVILLLFGSGLLLGSARYASGSVLVPIAMHVAWNLYAVW